MIPDILGDGFEQLTLTLPDDDEGPVVATLVRKLAPQPTTRAVLYVHGYVDYFFHTELANRFVAAGFNFYAIDLRKYGRSLRPYQTPYFCSDIHDYFADLDSAIAVIRERDGNDHLLLATHSTGGLIGTLYAHHRRNSVRFDGVFCNSPFFELNVSNTARRLGTLPVLALGRIAPKSVIPNGLSTIYGEGLHADYRGEWEYNLEWKPLQSVRPRAGWLRAVILGQHELHRGLSIPCPILVMSSTQSSWPKRWTDDIQCTDIVLNVDHMSRYAMMLGNHVTRIRIDGGMHDLVLSKPPVREHVYRELFSWIDAYVCRVRDP